MDKIMKHAAVRKWAICFSGILITLFLFLASAWANVPIVNDVSVYQGPTSTAGPQVFFSFSSDGIFFICTIEGYELPCAPGGNLVPPELLSDGAHELYINAYDAWGIGSTAVVPFLVDAQGPVMAVTQAPGPSEAGPDSTEATEIRWFALDSSPPITFQCTLDDIEVSCPLSVFTWANLCNGNHLLRIVAFDMYGNPGPQNLDGTPGATIVFDTSGGVPCPLTITASAGANGSISPSGTVTVNPGNDIGFMMNANTGYHIADVLVDGASVGAVVSYTFNNVTANHTISASFAKNPYNFSGFFSPVDNPPVVNNAKAGQAIPVIWRLTDANGQPLFDPASFKSLTSFVISCGSLSGDPASPVEEYAAGSSGLQYLGDGYWQFNWKTPKTYSGQCRMMVLTLGDGTIYTASFTFK